MLSYWNIILHVKQQRKNIEHTATPVRKIVYLSELKYVMYVRKKIFYKNIHR
jgi:hypothetical protein